MGRILLTQGQATVILSTGIICAFTLLLFLSGYVIQQRTVTSLQTAIRPRIPPPPPSVHAQIPQQDAPPELRPSRLFSREGRIAYTNLDAAQEASKSVDWKRLAHVQIARTHHDVCNAVMVLADLHRLKSPARKVLLFPQDWAVEKGGKKGDVADPFLDISRRLMKSAARRYGVELRPMSPVGKSPDGEGDVYSLASVYALTDVDRAMSIETPGLLLDAMALDAILAFTEDVPFAMLQDSREGDGVHSEDLLLLRPEQSIHSDVVARLSTEPGFNDTLLPTFFEEPLLLASTLPTEAGQNTLIRSIGNLHDATQHFNATAFLSEVSFIRFSDPKLPGPEYDMPWSQKVAARPKNKDADWTWTKMYGQFAQRRMEVCGLDLETWRG